MQLLCRHFRSFIYSFPFITTTTTKLFFGYQQIRHCRINAHSTRRHLSTVFANGVCMYVYIYIYIYIYYFVRGWRQFAFIHRGCINACMRAHRDGALIVTCRVYACLHILWRMLHAGVYGYTLNLPYFMNYILCIYVYIYIFYFRVMAHVATCRVLPYTQHLRNGACCHMPCMVIHSTFWRQTINASCMY